MYTDWNINTRTAHMLSQYLHIVADEQNDAEDHDEYHAAAEVVAVYANRGVIPGGYVHRWVESLIKKVPNAG